jgi:hypothetical protein
VAGGIAESGKVTYVPSRNTNVDCFEDRGATFSVIVNTFIENKTVE